MDVRFRSVWCFIAQSHVVKEYLDALAAALKRVDLLGEAYLWRGMGRAVMGPRPR